MIYKLVADKKDYRFVYSFEQLTILASQLSGKAKGYISLAASSFPEKSLGSYGSKDSIEEKYLNSFLQYLHSQKNIEGLYPEIWLWYLKNTAPVNDTTEKQYDFYYFVANSIDREFDETEYKNFHWLKNIVLGESNYILAKQHIEKVGELSIKSNSQVFDKYCLSALESYSKAEKYNSSLPQSPTGYLKTFSLQNNPDIKQAKYWFQEAINRRIDYFPAYDTFLNILISADNPKKELNEFAQAVLDSRLFNTQVPLYYNNILLCLSSLNHNNWLVVWQDPQVKVNLRNLFANYLKNISDPLLKSYIKANYAAVLTFAGEYKIANRIFKTIEVKDILLIKPPFLKVLDNLSSSIQEAKTKAEIMQTGEGRSLLAADNLLAEGKYLLAVEEYKKILTRFSVGNNYYDYILFKILSSELWLKNSSLTGNKEKLDIWYKLYGVYPDMLKALDLKYDQDIIRNLVELGLNVNNEVGKDNYPLLHLSAMNLDYLFIDYLSRNKAEINLLSRKTGNPNSALVALLEQSFDKSAEGRIIDTVKALIRNKININLPDLSGATALYYAVKQKNNEVAELLLKNGANAKSVTYAGESILNCAISTNDIKLVDLILYNNVDVNTYWGNTLPPIFSAILSKNPDILLRMLSWGASPNITNKGGITPLVFACNYADIYRVRVLINYGADVNGYAGDSVKYTPLFIAIENNNIELLKVLIENGADINKADSNSNTPLHYAVIKGNINIIKILLKSGADKSQVNSQGKTPDELMFLHGYKSIDSMLWWQIYLYLSDSIVVYVVLFIVLIGILYAAKKHYNKLEG